MIRFNYLRDGQPEFVARVLAYRLPRRWHNLVAAAATLAVACACAAGIEHLRLAAALETESNAELRYSEARATIGAMGVRLKEMESILAVDRALRRMRLSGPQLAARLARLGNAVSKRAWVESMTASSSTYAVKGHAADLSTFAITLARLVSSGEGMPDAMRVEEEGRGKPSALTFEVDRGNRT